MIVYLYDDHRVEGVLNFDWEYRKICQVELFGFEIYNYHDLYPIAMPNDTSSIIADLVDVDVDTFKKIRDFYTKRFLYPLKINLDVVDTVGTKSFKRYGYIYIGNDLLVNNLNGIITGDWFDVKTEMRQIIKNRIIREKGEKHVRSEN